MTMQVIKSTWTSLTDTLTVVRHYSIYSVYPLLSYVILLLVTFTALVPSFAGLLGSGQQDVPAQVLFLLTVYLAYGVLYFMIAFGNVALVTGIAARLDGRDLGLSAGIARASRRSRLIAVY